jgi:hypothetical protein
LKAAIRAGRRGGSTIMYKSFMKWAAVINARNHPDPLEDMFNLTAQPTPPIHPRISTITSSLMHKVEEQALLHI